MKRIYIFVLLIGGMNLLWAQSDSLNVYWTANPEPDMLKYLLQRSVNSGTFTDNQFIAHPDTHAVDRDIQPGNLYSYRLAAIDSAGNQSGFSAVVSAGIPQVFLTTLSIPSGVATTQDLGTLVQDPDDDPANLTAQISAATNLTVTRQGNALLLTPSPLNFTGSASFQLTVTDGMGFFDKKTVTVTVQTVTFSLSIPDMQFAEDNSGQIKLDTTYTDASTPPDQMKWTFSSPQNLNLNFDSATRILKVSSKTSNWFGAENFVVTAQNSQNVVRLDTVLVNITPVNDPPVLTIGNIILNTQQAEWIVDLDTYASDVDDAVQTLTFSFQGFQNFQFTFPDPNTHKVTITRLNNALTETGTLTVTDPGGLTAQKQFTIQVVENNTRPHIVGLNQINSAEDSLYVLALNNFVQDSTDNPQDLSWSIEANGFIDVVYDRTTNTARLIPLKDWFGETSLSFTVTDRLGASDQRAVPVSIAPRIDLIQFSVVGLPEGGAKAAWATDIPAITILQYWSDPAAKQSVTSGTTAQKNHTVTLPDAQADVVYNFRLTSQDTSRRFTVLADSTFKFTGNGTAAQKEIVVYPNPVKASSGNDRVFFDNLPVDVQDLTLYNIFGEQIYSTPMGTQSGGRFSLALINNTKLKLGSGYYIYLIKNQKNVVIKRGKIVLIR